MPADQSIQDSEGQILDTPENPMHEILKTCTRQSLCGLSTCPGCTLNPALNHIQNLNIELNEPASPIKRAKKPSTPNVHWITDLTQAFCDALQVNNVDKLQLFINLYAQKMLSGPHSFKFEHS